MTLILISQEPSWYDLAVETELLEIQSGNFLPAVYRCFAGRAGLVD